MEGMYLDISQAMTQLVVSVDREVERRWGAAAREDETRRGFASAAAALITDIERGSQRIGWSRGGWRLRGAGS